MACFSTQYARAALAFVTFAFFAGCAGPLALPSPPETQGSKPSKESPCRHGFDYGSGMVALVLPPAVHDSFVALHQLLAQRYASDPALQGDEPPYAPHLSLMYGVTAQNRPAIVAALESPNARPASIQIRSAGIDFWDSRSNNETFVVVKVADDDQSIQRLRDHLRGEAQEPTRHSFQPHITLAKLPRGTRLQPAQMQLVQESLQRIGGAASVLMITDACGLATGFVALQP